MCTSLAIFNITLQLNVSQAVACGSVITGIKAHVAALEILRMPSFVSMYIVNVVQGQGAGSYTEVATLISVTTI